MGKEELYQLFIREYKKSQLYDGSIPINANCFNDEDNFDNLFELVNEGKLVLRDCEGTAFELPKDIRIKLLKNNETKKK